MLLGTVVFWTSLLSLLPLMTCRKLTTELNLLTKRIGFCSNCFQYRSTDDFIIGKLTLTNLKLGDTVKTQFYHKRSKYNMHFNGSLLPNDSPEEIIDSLNKGKPIKFRVDFPLADQAPQLEGVYINGEEYCTTIFDESTDTLVLEYTLQVRNESLPVFENNINIPHFGAISTCKFSEMATIRNALTPSIDNGTIESDRGEYPWLAAIYKKENAGTILICSGSLITSELILTAAHCFQFMDLSAEQFVAHLGRHDLANNREENMVVREIANIILHPEYNAFSSFTDSDLALLKMQTSVSFTKNIQPICLWSETADEALVDGHSSMMFGWTSVNTVPKKSKTYIVSQTECVRSSSVYSAITSSRTLCAEKRQYYEPCVRGSGAGLILKHKGRWMLRGMISAGQTPQKRCDLQEYVVLSDIAKHLPWLENYIGKQVPPITGAVSAICGVSGTKSHNVYPWLAAVYYKRNTGEMFVCTGTLVSARSVLVPAHCFDLPNRGVVSEELLLVYFGRYDLSDIMASGVVVRDVATVFRHPKYKFNLKVFSDNDIALLQMFDPVSFTEYIKPICLWSEPAEQTEAVGQSATLLSWDILRVWNGTATAPQSFDVDISPLRQCQLEGYNAATSSRFLCTPRPGSNVDGILMLKRNGRWYLRGVISVNLFYGFRYDSRQFRVYADITDHLSWIQGNMLP